MWRTSPDMGEKWIVSPFSQRLNIANTRWRTLGGKLRSAVYCSTDFRLHAIICASVGWN